MVSETVKKLAIKGFIDFIFWFLLFYTFFYAQKQWNVWLDQNTITYCRNLLKQPVITGLNKTVILP